MFLEQETSLGIHTKFNIIKNKSPNLPKTEASAGVGRITG